MIKNLIAAAMASILITQPPQNTNDGTYYQDVNITESYEYETNEVNSVEDLVEGNIYKYSTYDKPHAVGVCTIYCDYINLYKYDVANIQTNANLTVPRFYQGNDNVKVWVSPYSTTTGNVIYNIGCYDAEFYFVLGENNNYSNLDISFISESDYLGEKTITVEPVETEGLYNMAYHFLYSRIYTNTELQGMETTLFGTTINMNMWLSHTTAIIIICLLLLVLIKFVIWLFKIVSGGMLWQ